MPTTDKIEILNISEDFYSLDEVRGLYEAEIKAGCNYLPLIDEHVVSVRGQQRTAWTLCRMVCGPDDRAFFTSQRQREIARPLAYPFAAHPTRLWYFTPSGELRRFDAKVVR